MKKPPKSTLNFRLKIQILADKHKRKDETRTFLLKQQKYGIVQWNFYCFLNESIPMVPKGEDCVAIFSCFASGDCFLYISGE